MHYDETIRLLDKLTVNVYFLKLTSHALILKQKQLLLNRSIYTSRHLFWHFGTIVLSQRINCQIIKKEKNTTTDCPIFIVVQHVSRGLQSVRVGKTYERQREHRRSRGAILAILMGRRFSLSGYGARLVSTRDGNL